MLLPAVLLCSALGAARPARTAEAVYAALPLRDLGATPGAADGLLAGLRGALEARGAAFVEPAEMERVLRERRIRYTDSVGNEDARAIGARTGARWILAGTLLDHVPGPDPHVALALRVLGADDGERVASAFVALRGRDFRGLLGLGAITDVRELEREALARLLERFEEDGSPRPEPQRRPGERPGDALAGFVAEGFDPGALRRVAVLPLVNRSGRVEAGGIFSELLSHEWFRAGVEVVEPSELRAAFVRQKVRSLDFVDDEVFARIGAETGARYFVLGSIDRYEEVLVTDESFPLVEASIRVLDTELRRLVAAASLRRRGDDYHVVLGLGNVRDPVLLTDRAAGEMIALILR